MKPLPIIITIAALVLAAAIFLRLHNTAEAPELAPEESVAKETIQETTPTEPNEDETEGGNNVVFNLTGTNFAYNETEIRVSEGDTVTIHFESEEGFHDWVVDEFGAATEKVRPGTPTSVTFVADTAGTYEYYCSVGSHRANGMVGTLIVE